MKRVLSLILGLMLLLTAFSSGVSADVYFYDFDTENPWVLHCNTGYGDTYKITDQTTVDLEYKRIAFDLKIVQSGTSANSYFIVGFIDGNFPEDGLQFKGYNSDGTYMRVQVRDGEQNVGTVPVGVWLHVEYETFLNEDLTVKYAKVLITDKDTGEIYINKTVTVSAFYNGAFGIYGRYGGVTVENGMTKITYSGGYSYIDNLTFGDLVYQVSFNLKDALTGQGLTGVTVKESNVTLGTISDGEILTLSKGTHTLTFEKSGYWSVTKTIDVQSDMSVSVEMYPSSTAFQFLNFPSDIQVYENSIYELTFTISPIDTSVTYNTYLSISGLSNVLEVKKAGQVITPESGKYYLGDISSDTQVSIKFKAGSIGLHSFTITLTSNDVIMSKTYTTSNQVSYEVVPLPFSIQFPSEWQVGSNVIRISEAEGNQLTLLVMLKDLQGNELWSESAVLGPYEAKEFQVNIPEEGSYILEVQYNGQVASWSITVNPSITLVTKTVQVQEGGEGTIVLHFKNPSDSVMYYTIVVSGGFLANEINETISLAPLSEKDVSIAFAVPSDLTYDAYELNVKVLQGDSVVFEDKVAVTIAESSGFSLPIGGSSSLSWKWILGALLVAGGVIAILRR
ncbi:MAG: hypothetical protein DRN90_00600 [Thermoproteota archaeon]|nr:MAG: hypothetical protein DRN90_00600 [Candidatus Korarchaeota archaeon]